MITEEKGTTSAAEDPAASHGATDGKGSETQPASATEPVKGTEAKSEAELRAELTKLQADLANFKRIEEERKAKEKKRQEELLKEQGKFRELYETAAAEAESMKKRLAKQDAIFKGMLDEELKGLPEDFDKTIIPEGEPFDQVVWLRKAKVLLGVKPSGAVRGSEPPPPKPGEPLGGMSAIYNHPTSPKH
jgi:hypothetical protein